MKHFGRALAVVLTIAVIATSIFCLPMTASAGVTVTPYIHYEDTEVDAVTGESTVNQITDITVQTISNTRYLFLPSNADLTKLQLRFTTSNSASEVYVVATNGNGKKLENISSDSLIDITSLYDVQPVDGIYELKINVDDYNGTTVRILKSSGVRAVFVNIDESLGTISNMNGSKDNNCYGTSTFTQNKSGETKDLGSFTIHGRGNASWSMAKKGYNIKFDSKQSVFDMKSNKSWVLLANYDDYSLLRNAIGFNLAENFGQNYTPDSHQVDLYFNGSYQGNYTLCEKIQAKDGRVEINDLEGNIDDVLTAYNNAYGTNYTDLSSLYTADTKPVTFNEDFSKATVEYETQGMVTDEVVIHSNIAEQFVYETAAADIVTEIEKFNAAVGTDYGTDLGDLTVGVTDSTGVIVDVYEHGIYDTLVEMSTNYPDDGSGNPYVKIKKKKAEFCYPGLVSANTVIDLTGGYIIECDWYDDAIQHTYDGVKYTYKSPENLGTSGNDIGFTYINAYIDATASADRRSNGVGTYQDKQINYYDMLDEESFAKMYIMKEYCMDWDCCRSLYMFKDTASSETGGKLVAGPVWDFDNALGRNESIYNGENGWDNMTVLRTGGYGCESNSFMANISNHEHFLQAATAVWDKYKDLFTEITDTVPIDGVETNTVAYDFEDQWQSNLGSFNLDNIKWGRSGRSADSAKSKLANYIKARDSYITKFMDDYVYGTTIKGDEIGDNSVIDSYTYWYKYYGDGGSAGNFADSTRTHVLLHSKESIYFRLNVERAGTYDLNFDFIKGPSNSTTLRFSVDDNEQGSLYMTRGGSWSAEYNTSDAEGGEGATSLSFATPGVHTVKIYNANNQVNLGDLDLTCTYQYCNHEYELTSTTPATCTAEGTKVYTCPLCNADEPGHSYTETSPALGHDWQYDKVVSEEEINSVTYYTVQYKCSRCGEIKTEVQTEYHDYKLDEATYVAPTCTADGSATYVCSLCGKSYTEVLDKLEHDYQGAITTPATCTETGVYTYTCTRCGDSYDRTIKALGHDLQTTRVEPTCTETGTVTTYCTRCDYEAVVVIPALGHSFTTSTVTKEPTCAEAGVRTFTCTTCGAEITEDIPALGHTFTSTCTATCTEAGLTTYTCSVCGYSYSEPAEALGHNYVYTASVQSCTGTTSGTYTCTRCGDTYAAEGQPMGHMYVETYDSATKTYAYKCIDCGDTQYVETTDTWEYVSILGKAYITKYSGNTAELTIPDTIDDKPVVGIKAMAFANNTALTELTIPVGIKSIYNGAFLNCTALTTIYYNATSMKTMAAYFDKDGDGWTDTPDSSIDNPVAVDVTSPFIGCTALESVQFGRGVVSIPEQIFADSTLKSAYVTSTITDIDATSFLFNFDLQMYGPADSYSETWAAINDVPYNRVGYSINVNKTAVPEGVKIATAYDLVSGDSIIPLPTVANGKVSGLADDKVLLGYAIAADILPGQNGWLGSNFVIGDYEAGEKLEVFPIFADKSSEKCVGATIRSTADNQGIKFGFSDNEYNECYGFNAVQYGAVILPNTAYTSAASVEFKALTADKLLSVSKLTIGGASAVNSNVNALGSSVKFDAKTMTYTYSICITNIWDSTSASIATIANRCTMAITAVPYVVYTDDNGDKQVKMFTDKIADNADRTTTRTIGSLVDTIYMNYNNTAAESVEDFETMYSEGTAINGTGCTVPAWMRIFGQVVDDNPFVTHENFATDTRTYNTELASFFGIA